MIERIAHAKVNLALHVTGQRDDGYHLLDSIVAFTKYGDRVLVDLPHHAHGPVTISIDGPFSDGLTTGPENLITSAAFLLRDAVIKEGGDPKPVTIHLEKNLPVASGIGGGSADAAATLLALREAWESNIDLLPIAKALGADVPMCLKNLPLRAQGIGDEVTFLNAKDYLHLVLVNPGIDVSTPEVFKRLENKNNPELDFADRSSFPDLHILAKNRNDLTQAAVEIAPEISTVIEALEKNDALLSRMSGSGATCFGIFEDDEKAQTACSSIAKMHPSWWCIASQTTC